MTDCWKCMVSGQEIPKTNAPPEYFRPSLASPSRTGDHRATDGEWIPQDAIEIISSDRPGGGMKSCGACRDTDSGQLRFRGNYFNNKTGSILNLDTTDECFPLTILLKSLSVVIFFGGIGK